MAASYAPAIFFAHLHDWGKLTRILEVMETGMGISRLVILILLGLAAWWVWKKVKVLSAAANERLDQTTAMVRCRHCQLHLPQPEAVRHREDWYCSTEHAQAGPRQT